jgi:hypothetical protein
MKLCHSIVRTLEQPGSLEQATASVQTGWQGRSVRLAARGALPTPGVDSESESPGGSATASALAVAQVKVIDLE